MKKYILWLCCITAAIFGRKSNTGTIDTMNKESWDKYGTRYTLVQSNQDSYNWLFFPGGPGADSSYFLPLINQLELPGNIWLIDLPGNGTNTTNFTQDYSFDQWEECLLFCIQRFNNPIYVGHSFGGMNALLHPSFENMLKGLIIISSCPVYDREEIGRMLKEKNITVSQNAAQEFMKNKNDLTFKNALLSQLPRHFPPANSKVGEEFLKSLSFNFYVSLWWMKKIEQYSVQWIPDKIPTLILGGSEDCINPISLFQKDLRFRRDNITITIIPQAGHFPWMDNMPIIKTAIEELVVQLR